jgi:hypothetical protein
VEQGPGTLQRESYQGQDNYVIVEHGPTQENSPDTGIERLRGSISHSSFLDPKKSTSYSHFDLEK